MVEDTDEFSDAHTSDERLDRLQQQLNRVTEGVNNLQDLPRVDNLRKLPRFVSNDPFFWFMQIESVFHNHRITTEATKAHHVIADLDPEILICARDIISARPAPANIFTQIKNRLISTYCFNGSPSSTAP